MIDQAPDTWHDAPGLAYGEAYKSAKFNVFVTAEDANAQALRSFWRGITIGFFGIGGIVALAVAVVVLA